MLARRSVSDRFFRLDRRRNPGSACDGAALPPASVSAVSWRSTIASPARRATRATRPWILQQGLFRGITRLGVGLDRGADLPRLAAGADFVRGSFAAGVRAPFRGGSIGLGWRRARDRLSPDPGRRPAQRAVTHRVSQAAPAIPGRQALGGVRDGAVGPPGDPPHGTRPVRHVRSPEGSRAPVRLGTAIPPRLVVRGDRGNRVDPIQLVRLFDSQDEPGRRGDRLGCRDRCSLQLRGRVESVKLPRSRTRPGLHRAGGGGSRSGEGQQHPDAPSPARAAPSGRAGSPVLLVSQRVASRRISLPKGARDHWARLDAYRSVRFLMRLSMGTRKPDGRLRGAPGVGLRDMLEHRRMTVGYANSPPFGAVARIRQ